MQRFEGHFKGYDQSELFFQTWTPDQVRGIFVITHGLSEHSESYHPLAKVLVEDGWKVLGWDLRGHGRSEGKRGYARLVDDLVADLDCFLRIAPEEGQNMILFGHSLGGLVTLRHLQTRANPAAAVVLSSPATGLTVTVPKVKETLAKIAARWAPTLTLYNEVREEDLVRDEAMWRHYRADTLRHDKISPGLFLSMVESFPLAREQAGLVKVPVLMQLSGEDRIVSTAASREVFDNLTVKKNQLIVYPGSLHEIYNDLDREQVINDLKKFISPYLGGVACPI